MCQGISSYDVARRIARRIVHEQNHLRGFIMGEGEMAEVICNEFFQMLKELAEQQRPLDGQRSKKDEE